MEDKSEQSRVLLINPWQTYDAQLESEYQSYIPYGLACIGAICIQEGFDTMIVDCLEDEIRTEIGNFVIFGKTSEEVEGIIRDFEPDIVGISSTFSMFEKDATEVASLVKKVDKRIIVVLGGVTATIPEIYEPLLLNSDVFDVMVRGEGEHTFGELIRNYDSETHSIKNLSFIKGIAYKTAGQIITTPERPFISNLDSLPYPALHLLNINKIMANKYYSRWRNKPMNKRSLPIFTSRGCPYNCCFCSVHSQVGYKYRTYSNEYVIELIKKCVQEYHINHFHFEDDNLTLNVDRAKKLFRDMIDLNITWDTPNGVRADRLDEEMIRLMIASGVTSISIAAESGNENVRMNIIHKNLKSSCIIRAAQMCDKYDLPCIVFFVLGFPGETIENIRESIMFAKDLSKNYGTINMLYIANPLPGTELSEVSKKKGYIKRELSNSDYFTAIRANQASIIETDEFDKKIIFNIIREELDVPGYSVHNVSLPMFWADSETAWRRARRVFPKMSDRKVIWEWKE